MAYSIDLTLFDRKAHNPSFGSLKEGLRREEQKKLVDFCVPVNPYFPTPEMWDHYRSRLEEMLRYYPDQNEPIARVLGRVLDLDPQTLVLANGSTEAITWIDTLFVSESLLTPIPTFGRWTDQPLETGKRLETYLRRPENDFALDVEDFIRVARDRRARAVAICNPNNPTGAILTRSELERLAGELSDLDVLIVDESFIDFSFEDDLPSMAGDVEKYPNLIVVKSLGKNFGMHGVRFGFAVANRALAARLRLRIPHWNINAIAEAVIRDVGRHWGEYEASRRRVIEDREYLYARLREVPGLTVFPSRANFVYFRCPDDTDGKMLRDELIRSHGYFIRECGNKVGAGSRYIRIAANPASLTDRLVAALSECLNRLGGSAAAPLA